MPATPRRLLSVRLLACVAAVVAAATLLQPACADPLALRDSTSTSASSSSSSFSASSSSSLSSSSLSFSSSSSSLSSSSSSSTFSASSSFSFSSSSSSSRGPQPTRPPAAAIVCIVLGCCLVIPGVCVAVFMLCCRSRRANSYAFVSDAVCLPPPPHSSSSPPLHAMCTCAHTHTAREPDAAHRGRHGHPRRVTAHHPHAPLHSLEKKKMCACVSMSMSMYVCVCVSTYLCVYVCKCVCV